MDGRLRGGDDALAAFPGRWRNACGVYREDGGLWSNGTSGTNVCSGDGARGFRVDRRGVPVECPHFSAPVA